MRPAVRVGDRKQPPGAERAAGRWQPDLAASDAPVLILESGLSMVDAEIEAIPEIRVHAADLARRLVSTTLR